MISSKSHKTLSFSQYLVPATIFFTGTGETFTSTNRHMPVSRRLCVQNNYKSTADIAQLRYSAQDTHAHIKTEEKY